MVKAEKIPEGYRATEAGILPVDWQVKRLSEIATELTERAGQDMRQSAFLPELVLSIKQKSLAKSYQENNTKSILCCIRAIFLITKETLKHLPKVAFTV